MTPKDADEVNKEEQPKETVKEKKPEETSKEKEPKETSGKEQPKETERKEPKETAKEEPVDVKEGEELKETKPKKVAKNGSREKPKETGKKEEPKKTAKKEPRKEPEEPGKKEAPAREGKKPAGEEVSEKRFDRESWKPRTKLGELVRKGKIASMKDVLHSGLPIKEVEIIDALLPDIQEEILNVGRVQRVTDSGRRMRFRVVTAVGNGNGYIGVGHAKGKEAGPTIRKAIEKAKLNLVEVKRGCGSWQCGCGDPHTIPFKVSGNSGSVSIELIPAPKGIGLVSGEIPKKILFLAGISDIWVRTEGHTRTSFNFAYATFNALLNTNYVKVKDKDIEKLSIVSGCVE